MGAQKGCLKRLTLQFCALLCPLLASLVMSGAACAADGAGKRARKGPTDLEAMDIARVGGDTTSVQQKMVACLMLDCKSTLEELDPPIICFQCGNITTVSRRAPFVVLYMLDGKGG